MELKSVAALWWRRLLFLHQGASPSMRSDQRFRYIRPYSDSFPVGVKWLLISNTAIFILMALAQQLGYERPFLLLELVPKAVIYNFAVWQLVTYMFLHGGPLHILFNMLTL